MVLEAPGRFSITKLCFRLSPNRSASIRAMTSVPPPAEAPTMILTGFVGQVWANVTPGVVARMHKAAAPARRASVAGQRAQRAKLPEAA